MKMAKKKRNRSTVVSFLLCVPLLLTPYALLTGCALPHVPSRIVYEDPVNFIRLEVDKTVLPEWPQGHFSHPAVIRKELVEAILLGLKVQEHRITPQRWIQGEAPIVSVFRDEEVALLSAQLVEGLAEARYNERVTFYLSQPLTFFRRMITSGGIYVQGNELHLLLGNWQMIYSVPAYGMIYDRRYPMRPTAAKGFDLLFEPAAAVIAQESSWVDVVFANTKDELVIDMSLVEVPVAPTGVVAPMVF